MRKLIALGAIVLVAIVLMVGLAPSITRAADHLDGPLVSADGRLDITDVYAFKHGNNTVLIMAVNPLAGVLSPVTFHPDASYEIKIDNNGDAKQDLTYRIGFSKPDHDGRQVVTLRKIRREDEDKDEKDEQESKVIAKGQTGQDIPVRGGGTVRAGLFDDPFFFDLLAFRGSVLGQGTRTFCDANKTNFFLGKNVSAIVLEVPSASLVGNTSNIGVWARTELKHRQIDRMGRPAINTVFEHTGPTKDAFNRGTPIHDQRDFRGDVVQTLLDLGNTSAYANAIADILLPDILTFDTSSSAGFLNGRRLADDVIDIELSVVTNGAITLGDCVGNDSTFSSAFPYLQAPN